MDQPLIASRPVSIDLDDGGPPLVAIEVRPDAESAGAKLDRAGGAFPYVIETYGGPQNPSAVDRWKGRTRLVYERRARDGIGTLVIDPRSSTPRGPDAAWPTAGRLGEAAANEIAAAAEAWGKRDHVAANALGINGWSFGGRMVIDVMTRADLAAGIAGGSVPDWRMYDAFYTERYMGTPQQNPDGYDATDVTRRASSLRGRLRMVHGEVDDNVHPASTMRMAGALQTADQSFELMVYPGAAHGVGDPKRRWHLRRESEAFWRKWLITPRKTP